MINWLLNAYEQAPDKVAIINNNQYITYSQLYRRSIEFACKLSEIGVENNTHVGILLSTSIEYVYLIYALIELGAITIPLNYRLNNSLLQEQIVHSDITLLVTDREINFDNIISLDTIISMDGIDTKVKRIIKETDTHCIIFTSGTTGNPKGVLLNYDNHYSSAISSAKVLGVEKDDIWLNCIPFYHVGGMEIIFRSCIYNTAMLLHNSFNIDSIIDSIKNKRVTMISLVPTMLSRILKKYDMRDNSLRVILLGGARTDEKLVKICMAHKLPIALTYGMTESCSQVATATTEIVRDDYHTVGPPLPGVEIRIKQYKDENYGEIEVRGPNISNGYYRLDLPEKYDDGFFRTGDLGYIKDGRLYVLQRRIDLIISGGENIIPQEVEDILLRINGIENAVVFGVQDEDWGERLTAALILSTDIDRQHIIQYCRDNLASYKIPKDYYIFDEFPQTASGKIIRAEIKSNYKNMYRL